MSDVRSFSKAMERKSKGVFEGVAEVLKKAFDDCGIESITSFCELPPFIGYRDGVFVIENSDIKVKKTEKEGEDGIGNGTCKYKEQSNRACRESCCQKNKSSLVRS